MKRLTNKTLGWLGLLIAFLSPLIIATDAAAAYQASFTASYQEVLASCEANGGLQVQVEGGYGCIKQNCDGQSGVCVVECTEAKNCIGTAPRSLRVRTSAATILGDCACVAGGRVADLTNERLGNGAKRNIGIGIGTGDGTGGSGPTIPPVPDSVIEQPSPGDQTPPVTPPAPPPVTPPAPPVEVPLDSM